MEAQLQDLQQRVATLECQPAPPSTSEKTTDPFWVVQGLEVREQDGVTLAGNVTLLGHPLVQWQVGLATETLLGHDWRDAAPVFAALGHPARLHLLRAVLLGQTRTADLSAFTTGQLYHHLRELVATGWLRPAGRGAHSIPTERVVPLLVMLAASDALPSYGSY